MLVWRRDETAVTRGDWVFSRIFSPAAWRRGLQDRAALLRSVAPEVAASALVAARWRVSRAARRLRGVPEPDPVRTWIRESARAICDRGCHLLFVFSAGDPGLGYLERHLGPGYQDELEQLGVSFETVAGATHTFHALWTQEALREVVERQLRRRGLLPERAHSHA
jgi:hypothetical protein